MHMVFGVRLYFPRKPAQLEFLNKTRPLSADERVDAKRDSVAILEPNLLRKKNEKDTNSKSEGRVR